MKFRAWDKKNKEFKIFDFNSLYGYEGEVCGTIIADEGVTTGSTVLNYNSGYDHNGMNENLKIDLFTDNIDIKKTELFENDIVYDNVEQNIYLIERKYGSFFIGDKLLYKHINNLTKIGNLYEDELLLKAKKVEID